MAAQSENVTVTGEAPLLDVGSASMGANVNEREVTELPINGRQPRGDVRGPSFRQMDLLLSKRVPTGGRAALELRAEVFNLFNFTNYANPSGRLNNALGTGTSQIQPGQPFTQAAAGSTFGLLTSTVGTTVGLGTSRQVQLAARLSF